jgi:tRNA A-37 threonylcarbamoyl transferase component Bud32
MNAEKNQIAQILSLDKSLNNLNKLNLNKNDTVKKQKSLNWNQSINNKSTKLKLSVAEPLNLSNYTLKKKQTQMDFHKSDSLNLSQSIVISSESSTGASINNFTLNFDKKTQEKSDPIDVTINNSYISGSNLYDSLVCRQTFYLENKNSVEEIEEVPLENMSMIEGIKTVDEMGFVLQEGTCENNEEEYIWDNSIKIVSFISQGAQAKVYLGLVMETESYVAIKRYLINYNETELHRILEECEIIKSIDHPNIIKYFDIEYVILEHELGEEYSLDKIQNKMMTRIDLIMEYLDGVSLKDYVLKYVKENNSGLPRDKVKYITKCILEGLKHLHENKVIHRDLKVGEK